MELKVESKVDFPCNICNKNYSSYKSLWNHNNKFHTKYIFKKTQKPSNSPQKSSISLNECTFCNKSFNRKDNLLRHKKTCQIKINNNKIDELEEKNKKLEETINKLKNQVSLIIKEKGKIHHKTLQKINNQLNINNAKITNNINNTYVKFGDVDYEKVLNNKQIKHILNQQYQSLEESIKQIHFNEELPEYSNIFITNMKDVNNKIKFIILSINDKP